MLNAPITRMGGKSKLRKTIIETKVNYSVSKDKKGRGKYGELIITNY
ncbi:hypothetical protein [Clostridium botulinum]|nr:hypothetical protein [Clostridium botulinum]